MNRNTPPQSASSFLPAGTTGPHWWRSLEELAETDRFRTFVENEFPGYDPQQFTGPTRRQFIALMGASLMLAGLAGCRRWPRRQVVPYNARPQDFVPGRFERYATAYELSGVAKPLLVTAVDGRPIKIEGNPDHPASRGAADRFAQASILDLYNPYRLPTVRRRIEDRHADSTWPLFEKWVATHLAELAKKNGEGFVVLGEATASPTVLRLRQQLQEKLPKMRWLTWEPIHRDIELEGIEWAFRKRLRPHYHFDKAGLIVAIDSDFLMTHPDALRHARDFATGRNPDSGTMNRLIVAEPIFTVTGSMADRRFAIHPSHCWMIGLNIWEAMGSGRHIEDPVAQEIHEAIKNRHGDCLVVPGQFMRCSNVLWAINHRLDAIGKTVTFTEEPAEPCATELPDDIDTLLILGGNPAYDAPPAIADPLAKARHAIHLTLAENETSRLCEWVLPQTHYLEAWGDARSYDGTISIVQPLIRPLFEDAARRQGGRSVIELLAMLLGEKVAPDTGRQHVRRTLRPQLPDDKAWRKALHDGLVENSAYPTVHAEPFKPNTGFDRCPRLCLDVRPDYTLYDGRFADNGWLQELPDPITKVTWDNAALLSPADAKTLGVGLGDMVDIELDDGVKLTLPVYVLPGQAAGAGLNPDNSDVSLPYSVITTTLGYGRQVAGPVGRNVGFNTYRAGGVGVHQVSSITRSSRKYDLVTTQDHHAIDVTGMRQRGHKVGQLIREQTLEQYLHRHGGHGEHGGHGGQGQAVRLQMYDRPDLGTPEPDYQWAMAIDLNKCIGCQACVVACQAENNIPIVGKDEVRIGREMHWLRVDRYFAGRSDGADVRAVHQPMMCQHCEDAPCEQVCPVAATVHDAEGLNVMVYNRCIGTRYCANNCPYKVRRFNYFDYHVKPPHGSRLAATHLGMPDTQQSRIDPLRQMQFNPQVTVRMRGVMEKCTYCTQRIQAAKSAAKVEQAAGRRDRAMVADGEILPACAQACPTQAIVFGNLKDPSSRVAQLHRDRRAYGLLDALDIKPRTRYLMRIRNAPAAGPAPANDEPTA